MDPVVIDKISINFNPNTLLAINIAIGIMMLGVALDLKLDDFKRIAQAPKAPVIGLMAQFILLPAFTFILTMVLPSSMITPSMALGMILVAACPGGNLSNIITYLAKGNSAISISMTAISSIAAIVMTPFNLSLWGNLNPRTAPILQKVSLSPADVFFTIFIILGIPLLLGITISRYFPNLVLKVRKPFKIFSLTFFMLLVAGALISSWAVFMQVLGLVVFVVFLHNLLALLTGYGAARVFRLNARDSRAVCIEVGIQNSALGLVLVFSFFGGLGGMAIIVAWWGTWHIVAGLTAAFIFTRFGLPDEKSIT
ncbi:bile acid:sodium symporter family protein [bacterium]|nr:bile acid:sodium symporter family protein [bacterium]